MRTLVRMRFGSHLYGTATEASDTDYKSVFMPWREHILLGRIPKSVSLSTKAKAGDKNTAADVDDESYSLHYFLKLACDGETVALDMLHARHMQWESGSPEWWYLHSHRSEFYTKNLRALIGYARRQAAKYGIRGSRLETAERVMAFLKEKEAQSPGIRLEDVWDEFPAGEHIHKQERTFPETVSIVQVCGKNLQSTARASLYIESMGRFVDSYGARARLAKDNAGIDWKAVSHAFRAAYQVQHILTDGDFEYPLPETSFISQVKSGAVDYLTVAAPRLDAVIAEVEEIAARSALPETCDRLRWDRWLIAVVDEEVQLPYAGWSSGSSPGS